MRHKKRRPHIWDRENRNCLRCELSVDEFVEGFGHTFCRVSPFAALLRRFNPFRRRST
jgi:hypothetical protein